MPETLISILTLPETEHLLRILLAALCGGAIGFERESRRKTAGLRTHVIVSISSALLMLISKYGFGDVLGEYVRLDPSRIAAGVVTAIGFLGSGIIFYRNNSVSGLTTSAGVWATLGVGMAVGSGMYFIGVSATVLIVFVEIFIGRKGRLAGVAEKVYRMELEYRLDPDSENRMAEIIKSELINRYACKILKFHVKRKEETIQIRLLAVTVKGEELIHLTELAEKYPEIVKISL